MSYLKELRDIAVISDIQKSLESNSSRLDYFSNTEYNIADGPILNLRKKTNKYSLESWDDLTYTTDDGDTIKIPANLKDFKDFVEKEQKEKVIDIKKWGRTLKFNPRLSEDEIKTVGGDTYKGLECRYMVPFASWSIEKSSRIGDTVYIYDVHVMAVVYCDPNSRFFGKMAVFTIGNSEDFDNFNLKDYWGIFKFLQPSFNQDTATLISDAKTGWSKLKETLNKIKGKLSKLFKVKRKEDASDTTEE